MVQVQIIERNALKGGGGGGVMGFRISDFGFEGLKILGFGG